MTDKTELSKDVASQVPAFMKDVDDGKSLLKQYVRPPRLKIVQKMSKEPFDQYPAGSIFLVPQMVEFVEFNAPTKTSATFQFVPIFFYPEYIQTNPVGESPFVRERSFDPKSALAHKARDRETWFEPHPDKPGAEIANREVLNFVVMPYNHPMSGTLCVMSFSKAEYKTGTVLAGMIDIRKGAPIFGQIFEAHSSDAGRSNPKGTWFGFDINIPENPFVTREEFETFHELHKGLEETHQAGLLQVDYDDVPEGADTSVKDETEF